jgi:hypothetical protein
VGGVHNPMPYTIWDAAASGDVNGLKSLLKPENGNHINMLDDFGRTCLHIAATTGSVLAAPQSMLMIFSSNVIVIWVVGRFE